MRRVAVQKAAWIVMTVLALCATACGGNEPPVAKPAPPPSAADGGTTPGSKPPAPPEPVRDPVPVPPEPAIDSRDRLPDNLDDLNRNSPLKPVYFDYDSAEVNSAAQAALDENAATLKQYSTWTVTIEGHGDERGTAEYNLALGERRAVAARTYLVSLGISADRLRTVSYGEEFPFDPGKDEAAYAKNRRAHFVVTAR
jgi:peptidoglycan-associated lipoprotein